MCITEGCLVHDEVREAAIARAIEAYTEVLSRMLRGERTKKVRDDYAWAWVVLEDLSVAEDDPRFVASVRRLRP
jgi:hypothetical protein